jgi:hypothetical protein
MVRQMLLSLPVALVIGLSAQVAGQVNKIPDQAREILEKASQFELLPSFKPGLERQIKAIKEQRAKPIR